MSNDRKLNRDHAKKTQRPMVGKEVIANNQLEALLTPAITAQENYYRHDSRVPFRVRTRGS